MGEVILKRKMVSSLLERNIISKPTTIQALINRLELPAPIMDCLTVTLDGEFIARSEWAARQAGTSSIVGVTVVPQGKTIRKLLPIVALIALAVVAPYIAPTVAGALGLGGGAIAVGAVTAGIMFVGALAINALFPPPSPEQFIPNGAGFAGFGSFGGGFGGGGGASSGDAAGYHVTGIRNTSRPHGAVRVIYGTRKVGPDLAAENLVLSNGDTQTLYSLFDFGYGRFDISQIKIGNTPISNYKGAQYKIRQNYKTGTLTYYKNDHTTDTHAVELRFVKVVRVAPDSNSNEVVVEISFPMGLGWFDGDDGDFNYSRVGFDLTFRNTATGSVVNLYSSGVIGRTFSHTVKRESGSKTFSINRRTKHPFSLSVAAVMSVAGPWEVQINRNSKWPILYDRTDTSKDSNLDKSVLTAIRSVTYRNPLNFRTGHTILELRLTATDQLAGAIDTLTAIVTRRIQVWTGSAFSSRPTDNPAWIALDILTGQANPDPIKYSRIDLDSFKAWAVFCDRAAPSGGGSYYTCAANWDGISTVYDRLMAVMSAGRATISMRENKYSVVFESFPTTPVQMFTPRNSWGFKATKEFTKTPHALKMGFIDPDSDWQQQEILVYADGKNQGNADYFESINLPLVTRSDQAWRDGRYYLAQGLLRPENFTITADIENLICERGDLVTVQHDVARMGGIPARIKSIIGNDLILDDFVAWDSTGVFKARIRYQDGDQAEITVSGQPGPDRITLASAPTKANVGDLVIFGKVDFIVDEMLVKSVTPSEDLTATLNLVPIARAIEDADKGTIPPYDPPITPDDMYDPKCLAVTYEASLYYKNRYPFVDFNLAWPAIGSNVAYEVWVKTEADGGDFELVLRTDAENHIIWEEKSMLDADYPAGEMIEVVVLPVNVFGYKPAFESCTPISIIAPVDILAPGKPLFMAGNINRQTMAITWLPPIDQDIGGYILKYSPDLVAPDWGHATIETPLIPHSAVSIEINARIGSYMLKTIDTSGNISKEFALVRTTIPELDGLNVIERIDEHPDFTGTHSQTETLQNALVLINTGGEYATFGTYNSHKLIDLGHIASARIHAEVIAQGIDINGADSPSDAWSVETQVRTANALVVMADWKPAAYPNNLASVDPLADSGGTIWSGWQRLTAGNFSGRYFQFRAVLTTSDPAISPKVTALTIELDMEDRILSGHDINSTIGGSRHLFTPAFINFPAVAITGEYLSQGDYFVLTNIRQDGFDLEFFNAAHDSIVARYDFIAKGYGQRMAKVLPAIEAGKEDPLNIMPGALASLRKPNILQ